eukprot:2429228-Prymnesium_polylepis.4
MRALVTGESRMNSTAKKPSPSQVHATPPGSMPIAWQPLVLKFEWTVTARPQRSANSHRAP